MRILLLLALFVACGQSSDGKAKPQEQARAPEPVAQVERCELKVRITADGIQYPEGLAKTECDVTVDADPDVTYQEVVAAMDELLAQRIQSFGIATTRRPKPRKPPPEIETTVNPDMSISMKFKDGVGPAKSALVDAPAIVVTKTEVTIRSKLGETTLAIDDAQLAKKIIAALPATTYSELAIFQADAQLPYKTISIVVNAANDAGYGDLLFAVKNR